MKFAPPTPIPGIASFRLGVRLLPGLSKDDPDDEADAEGAFKRTFGRRAGTDSIREGCGRGGSSEGVRLPLVAGVPGEGVPKPDKDNLGRAGLGVAEMLLDKGFRASDGRLGLTPNGGED